MLLSAMMKLMDFTWDAGAAVGGMGLRWLRPACQFPAAVEQGREARRPQSGTAGLPDLALGTHQPEGCRPQKPGRRQAVQEMATCRACGGFVQMNHSLPQRQGVVGSSP